jgi:hypothetical protein
MTRSVITFEIELRIRNMDGGFAVGTASRYLYTDKTKRTWIRCQDEWHELESSDDDDEELDENDLHVYVQELPPDVVVYGFENYNEEAA